MSAGKARAISAKSSTMSSRLQPTTPRHKLNKLGGAFLLLELKNSAKPKYPANSIEHLTNKLGPNRIGKNKKGEIGTYEIEEGKQLNCGPILEWRCYYPDAKKWSGFLRNLWIFLFP